MRLMLVFCHLIMSSNKIRARQFQHRCDVCALPGLFHSSAFTHTHMQFLTLDKHAETHTLISPRAYTPVSPVKSNQIE